MEINLAIIEIAAKTAMVITALEAPIVIRIDHPAMATFVPEDPLEITAVLMTIGLNGQRSEKPFLRKGSIVYILDILQHGRMDRTEEQAHRSFSPLCQIIEVPNFHLFEIELNKGANVAIQDKVVITGEEGSFRNVFKSG